jgi:outer membrane protein assembly factor BamB
VVRRVRSLSIALVIVLAASVLSGQQPKRKREPYIAPLLPAEQAWKIALPALPAAAAAMDDTTVYVPLEDGSRAGEDGETTTVPAVLVALNRETGATRWTLPIASRQPPVLTHGVVVLATPTGVEAVDPRDGQRQWSIALDRPVRVPMVAQGSLLLAMLEGDQLLAIHLDRHEVAWRRSVGESGPLVVTADAEAAYVATNAGRVMRVALSDGVILWEQRLAGELSQPTIDGDRLFVGSNADLGSLWSLDRRSGDVKWAWRGKIFGGSVVGTAVNGTSLYVTSQDNIVRALSRNDGGQRWKKPLVTRPLFPPRVFSGVVMVTGGSPALSTFRADSNGTAISTWAAPADALLQGPPLIAEPAPLKVAIVVVLREGQVIGLRPTEMLFKDAPLVPLTTLPGRALPREP